MSLMPRGESATERKYSALHLGFNLHVIPVEAAGPRTTELLEIAFMLTSLALFFLPDQVNKNL